MENNDSRNNTDLPNIMYDAFAVCNYDVAMWNEVCGLIWRSFDAGVIAVRDAMKDGRDLKEIFATLLTELDRPE